MNIILHMFLPPDETFDSFEDLKENINKFICK